MRGLSANERALLSIIRRLGSVPRADVARASQLAQQSVHRLLVGLHEERLLVFGEADIRGRGKPSPSVSIDASYHASLGVSVSPEAARYCLVDLAGSILASGTLGADPLNREAVLSGITQLLADLAGNLLSERHLIGLGLSVPQAVAGGVSPDWPEILQEAELRARFGLPCFVRPAAAARAIAEHLHHDAGAGQGCLAYLSFDEALGCGLLVNGAVFSGGQGRAGQLEGLFPVTAGLSGPALGTLIARHQAAGSGITSIAELRQQFRAEDPVVSEWLTEVTPQLHLAVRALRAVADPNVIYFGGAAPDALRDLLVQRAVQGFTGEAAPVLRVSRLSGDVAHLGAALLPLWHQIY